MSSDPFIAGWVAHLDAQTLLESVDMDYGNQQR
jgi:hypothetical protein